MNEIDELFKSDLLILRGDYFNIEAVCPDYLPDCQHSFTWRRDEDGIAIVSGYEPDEDERNWWLCECGNFETSGFHCSDCGAEPPWGCDCGMHDDYYEPEDDWDFFIGFYGDVRQ